MAVRDSLRSAARAAGAWVFCDVVTTASRFWHGRPPVVWREELQVLAGMGGLFALGGACYGAILPAVRRRSASPRAHAGALAGMMAALPIVALYAARATPRPGEFTRAELAAFALAAGAAVGAALATLSRPASARHENAAG